MDHLDPYEEAAFRYLASLHRHFLLAMGTLTRMEKIYGMAPCELVRNFFPLDPLQRLLEGTTADNDPLRSYIDELFLQELA